MNDHTLFVREGRWQISGSTIDVAGNANIAIGVLVVESGDGAWLLDEQINELRSRHEIAPPPEGAAGTTFRGVSGLFGQLSGCLVFFEDLILSTYRSEDQHYQGCESIRRIDSDRYESRGALFLDGAYVSSWSYVLQRA